MVVTLNDIMKDELLARKLAPTQSLTKTIWQFPVSGRDEHSKWSGFIWVCDVHEDFVVVFYGEDYKALEVRTFRATDPNFVTKVFQAIDKAIVRKS